MLCRLKTICMSPVFEKTSSLAEPNGRVCKHFAPVYQRGENIRVITIIPTHVLCHTLREFNKFKWQYESISFFETRLRVEFKKENHTPPIHLHARPHLYIYARIGRVKRSRGKRKSRNSDFSRQNIHNSYQFRTELGYTMHVVCSSILKSCSHDR